MNNQYNHDSYELYTTPTTNSIYGTDIGIFLVVLLALLFIFLAVYAVYAILLGLVFKKAGVSQGIAWVPIYNNWKTLEIGGQQGFWAVLSLMPIVSLASLVFMYIAFHNINKKLGYDGGMTALAVFLPFIWLLVLALGNNTWNESLGAARLDTPSVASVQQ